MGAGNHNPHWDQLAASGQFQQLSNEVDQWRQGFSNGLRAWMQSCPEWSESAQPLLGDLVQLEPEQLTQNWVESREQLAALNRDGLLLREEYLQQLGPTPLSPLNSFLTQLEQLAQEPQAIAASGSVLLAELKSFEAWASENSIHGAAYEQLRLWLENCGLGLLSRKIPNPGLARAEMLHLWEQLCEEHARQAAEQALGGPTQSARWNSWILLLELCERETQDSALVLDSLDSLDADVEDVARRQVDQTEVAEVVADYREASEQLREALHKGKRLKGWSQILPPILVELDLLVPREPVEAQPVSRVRQLCQEFEAGILSTEQFQAQLQELEATLSEGRKQSRILSAQHPSEAAFVEALGKLQGGLDILMAVERSGQASRLEMGSTLVEEGLAQLEKLEAGDG